MINAWIQWLGSHFSPEQYVWWTRVQCTAWTLADLVIVYYLLRTANLARRLQGALPHRFSYLILFATLPIAAFIPLAPTGSTIFALELVITMPHFVIIVYVLMADAPRFAAALNVLLRS